MVLRIRTACLAVISSLAVLALAPAAANANLLSVLPASCGLQPETQPFAKWGDSAKYTPVAGGSFEAGALSWKVAGGAAPSAGNETYYVSGPGVASLALPGASSATSPSSCTSIYHPTVRFFVRNTGAASSRLTVQALYPGLLGGTVLTSLGQVSGGSNWQPSPALELLVSNLLSTVSLNETTIAFRFVPADSTGNWRVDDVYVDPFGRS